MGRSYGNNVTGDDFRHIFTLSDAFYSCVSLRPGGQYDLLLGEGDSDRSLRPPGACHGDKEVSLQQDLMRVDVGAARPSAHCAMIRSFLGPDLGVKSFNMT